MTQDASGYCDAHIEWGREKAETELAKRRKIADEQRGTSTERGYNARWRKARATFLRRNPLCAECGKPAIVVDHIVPHRGDSTLFWDTLNWAAMCVQCHNKKTARGE